VKALQFFFCFFLLCDLSFSQILTGVIKDNSTKEAIPFASVGVVGTLNSTLCDEHGNFKLSISNLKDTDTLRVSSIGYTNLSMAGSDVKKETNKVFYLKLQVYDLSEIKIKPKKPGFNTLGTYNYSKNICTAFVGESNNWRGEQAAIRAINKSGAEVYIESFNFYIIKNEYTDSLQFRIMLYEVNEKGFPGETFLKKPVIFKTNVKRGEVRIDLTSYSILTKGDFFISLECLEEKMESAKFCFAGSIKVPSFVKTTPFANWVQVKGGGGDFNVTVSYVK
jgi:hypothetical protein